MKKEISFAGKVGRIFLSIAVSLSYSGLLFFVQAPVAHANTSITVNNTSDDPGNSNCTDGTVTLREAFSSGDGCVNDNADRDTAYIVNLGTGTYLTSDVLQVTPGVSITVTGAGASSSIVNGTGSSGIEFSGGANVGIANITWNQSSGQAVFKVLTASTGNISIVNTTITGGADWGIWLGNTDGFTITGNVTISNNTITANGSGVYIGPSNMTLTTPLHVTGALNINQNNINVSDGSDAAITVNSAYSDDDATINANTIILSGTGNPGGIAVVDHFDLAAVFGSDVTIFNNNISAGSPVDSGDGIGVLELATGTITIQQNTIQLTMADGHSPIWVADATCFGEGSCNGVTDASILGNSIDVDLAGTSNNNAILSLAKNGTITDNTINLSDGAGGVATGTAGIVCGSVPLSPATCDIERNIVHGFSEGGIDVASLVTNQTLTATVANNLVYHGRGAGLAGVGLPGILVGTMGFGGGDPSDATIAAKVFNNTIYDVTTGTGTAAGGGIVAHADDSGGGTDHVTVTSLGNIINNNGNGYAISKAGGSEDVTITSRYNDVYNNTADSGSNFNGITPGVGTDYTADPGFTDAGTGDFTLQLGHVTIDNVYSGGYVSNSITAPTVDITGHARPERADYDMGAYEYVNSTPTANAGTDIVVFISNDVALHCASTDADDDTIEYAWTQTAGSAMTLTGENSADLSFTATTAGTFTFRCTTSDAYATGANDSVTVTVDTAPTVDAGADQYTSIDEVNTLDCSGSSDPDDGDTLEYTWSQTAGSAVTLSDTSDATPSFTPTTFGDRSFQCLVSDTYDAINTDTVTVHATAKRISGADRYATAVAISQNRYTDHSVSAVVIASGENFPGALTAGPLAAVVGGPVLLSTKKGMSNAVKTEIARLWNGVDDDKTDVYVIGGTDALTSNVINQAQAINSHLDIKRIAGTDRVGTAIEVAKEMASYRGLPSTNFAIATGNSFNDAAAMSVPASDSTINSRYIPILLNSTNSLDSRVSSYLSSNKAGVTKMYIAGNTTKVTSAVQTSLNSIFGSSKVVRMSGLSASAQAVAIANQFYGSSNSPTTVTIASSVNFPAVLTGGPFAGSKHGPLLYTDDVVVEDNATDYLDGRASTLTKLYVIGGTSAISDSTKQTFQQHL